MNKSISMLIIFNPVRLNNCYSPLSQSLFIPLDLTNCLSPAIQIAQTDFNVRESVSPASTKSGSAMVVSTVQMVPTNLRRLVSTPT